MRLSYEIDMEESSRWLMATVGTAAKANLPYVQELGDFRARGNYYTTREGLPSFLIKYTLSGEGTLEYNGRVCSVPKGHFFWIDCEKPQQYQTSGQAGSWRVIWVHFTGAGSRYYYEQFLLANGGQNVGVLPEDSAVPSSIYSLMDLYEAEKNFATDMRASALLCAVMAECVAAVSRREGGTASGYVREARDYMLSHYAERITLDSLARQLALNKFYLQKLYRQHTGQTPNEYLLSIRLSRAKELLCTTEKSVGTIAAEVGIENVSYFIKLFTQSQGTTPNVFRRQWLNK